MNLFVWNGHSATGKNWQKIIHVLRHNYNGKIKRICVSQILANCNGHFKCIQDTDMKRGRWKVSHKKINKLKNQPFLQQQNN